MQEVGDIVREVRQDLADMTPPTGGGTASKIRHETSGGSTLPPMGSGGLAEVDLGEEEGSDVLPTGSAFRGNPWELLSQPGRMRIGCGYLAAESGDILGYARKLGAEMARPYTLGMVVAEPQVWEDALPAMAAEPRMFGAIGYGPRTVAGDLQVLDETLTALLNDNPKLIAVGLLGLDEPYAPYALKAQQAQMTLQLELAADFGVPAYIGHRKSLPALTAVLENAALPRLIWADVLQDEAELALIHKYDMHVLVRPELTHATPLGQTYKDLIAKVAPNRHLLSSGSTLVAAAGREGERNSLSGLDASLKALAELMGEQPRETVQRSNNNAQALFYRQG